MNKYIKYLKSLLYVFIPMLVFSIITSILYYFNITSSSLNNYLKLFSIAISIFIGGIYIGTKADNKGWLEGIKIGLIVIFLVFVISYLAFDNSIDVKDFIYYSILLVSSILGSMIGINKKKS